MNRSIDRQWKNSANIEYLGLQISELAHIYLSSSRPELAAAEFERLSSVSFDPLTDSERSDFAKALLIRGKFILSESQNLDDKTEEIQQARSDFERALNLATPDTIAEARASLKLV